MLVVETEANLIQSPLVRIPIETETLGQLFGQTGLVCSITGVQYLGMGTRSTPLAGKRSRFSLQGEEVQAI